MGQICEDYLIRWNPRAKLYQLVVVPTLLHGLRQAWPLDDEASFPAMAVAAGLDFACFAGAKPGPP